MVTFDKLTMVTFDKLTMVTFDKLTIITFDKLTMDTRAAALRFGLHGAASTLAQYVVRET